ncbi:MAG: hypothetical protein KatS3mg071_2448 [Meiothermus sp.]|nr:MAG: hypothetical protein KatS3mg071_2448 [Meiothermus sp.]
MLRVAKGRGFAPAYVLMDSWYASLENLKGIVGLGWRFLTRLKGNRLVNPEGAGLRPVSEVEIPPAGRVVHLKGFGLVRVFRTVSKDGDAEYWATNDLGMREEQRGELERAGWGIEVYHRGLKGCCGVERAQVRKKVSVLGHLLLALRAFLRLEAHRLRTGVSWSPLPPSASPWVSTSRCRLCPFTFLPASYPLTPLFPRSSRTGCPASPHWVRAGVLLYGGFPVGQVAGHHAPGATGAGDVEEAVQDFPPGMLPGAMGEEEG